MIAALLASTTLIIAAGDLACDRSKGGFDFEKWLGGCHEADTYALARAQPYRAFLALGDEQYQDGTLAQFDNSYDKLWGRLKAITHPSPGNHEYYTRGARGYFAYFGRSAGDPRAGYYSFDLGTWHLISLNGNCWAVGGCGSGSPQERWLAADLHVHRGAACTLAYWHQPRFSSGTHHSDKTYQALWSDLYAARADLVLNGHDHDYERFSPQTPAGAGDPVRGIREIVAGTGGRSHSVFYKTEPNSEVRDASTFGVLELALHANGYDWRFVPVAGGKFSDRGSALCHKHVVPGL
ncbi:MAG TPA: metallophosphoesterase [Candidatus Tumulicola sp.]|nr:metallophosphoesterase [Candidatus Tumulicola sp.]